MIGLIALFTSCNHDDDTQPEPNFYALTVGNSWNYKYYSYDHQTDTYTIKG